MAIFDETTPQILVAVLLFSVTWYILKRRNAAQRLLPGTHAPPCIMHVPILGSLPFMSVDPNNLHQYLMEQSVTYGNVFALYLGSRYAIVLNGAESIREALLKKPTHFADRARSYLTHTLNPEHKGIVLAPYDDKFRQKRQLCLSIMKQFGFGKRIMETRINDEVTELIKQVRLIGGKPFDPNEMLHRCVVNVITSILIGKRYEYEDPKLRTLVRAIYDTINLAVAEVALFPILRFIPPFRQRVKLLIEKFSILMEFIEKEVDDVIKQCNDDEQDDTNDSFIRQFIQSTPTSDQYDRVELLITSRDLFQAGDDTSSTTLRWILLNLANHPDAQSRMQKEVDTVVGSDRLPSLADEMNMPFTQAFILETMRRYTLAPLSVFRKTLCDTQVGDCFVPAETLVIVNLYSAHMDPKVWDEPHSFKPERFLNEDGQVTGKDRVIPFALGKRSCLGESLARQDLFLFTSGIVQNFDVRPPEGQTEIACKVETTILTAPSTFQLRMLERTH